MRIDINYFVFLEGDIDRKFEAERAYKVWKENLVDIDPTRGIQYFFIVQYIKVGKKEKLEELHKSIEKGDGRRSADNLYKEGILEDWIRISYTPSLKDEYPEMKNADEVEKRFRIFYNITRE